MIKCKYKQTLNVLVVFIFCFDIVTFGRIITEYTHFGKERKRRKPER